MTNGLNGAQILVTRPVAQASGLSRLIQQRGGQPLRFPTLEIRSVVVDAGVVENALGSDWLIFTSTNAVDFALKALGGKMQDLKTARIAAVGQATANALQQAGFNVACVPETEFNSEGLLAKADMQQVQVSNKHITIVRGIGGREKLAETLRSRGATVDYLEVYCRHRPDIDNSPLIDRLCAGTLSATTITSGEALQNLLAMLDTASATLLRKLPLVVVSDRIGQQAQQLGFEHIAVSLQPTDAAILETLTTLLNGENSGRSN